MIKTLNRKTVCEVLLNTLDNNDLNHVLMMDETNFHLCSNVNSQNCRYRATNNPRDIHQKPLHSKKVWCSIFWGDQPLLLWRRGRQGNNSKFSPLHWDFWNWSCRDLMLKLRLSGFSKTVQRLSLWGLQCESSTRCSQLARSHKEGILNGLQDCPISTPATLPVGISQARCMKRNQGQQWTWNRTSGMKWQ